ncbi:MULTISPECIES: glycosyltransferase [Kordiimonas]|jgi:tetratricopeptide (TPR) repeat protein|uniref:glycosyltransferase n=1 Tax=Kordiimonas TaxID=288021 RepID=UPI00257D74F6|nr:glycosyltransferase [Kordiimonas sp. UBA4487]
MSRNQEQDSFARIFGAHLLADIPDVSSGGHVPRRLIQFWDKEPPQDVARMLSLSKAWADKHQLEYVLFSEADARAYLADRQVDGKSLLQLFDRCFHPAMKADLFRLVYLHEYGGYYLDADNGVTDDALALFGLDRDVFFIDFRQRRVQNNFMAVAPGSLLISKALSAAARNIEENASEDVGIGTLTGPYVFTVELAKLLQDGGYTCYLVDYLKNVKIAPGPEVVLGQNLDYKKSDQNWQRAQAGPIAARLRTKLTTEKPTIPDFRELCRISLKFGIELEALEDIAAANWAEWRHHSVCIELRSRVLIRLQRFDKAREILTDAYDRYIRPASLLKILSGISMKPERLEFAETLAWQAVEKAPADPDAQAQLAAVFRAGRKLGEAKAVVALARERFSQNARLRKLAEALEEADSLADEIAAMTKLLAAPETTGKARFRSIAKTCLYYGLHLEAVEQLADAWWPFWRDTPMCVWLRARILEKLGRVDDARTLLEEAYEKKLRAPNILIMLAQLALDAGEAGFADQLAGMAIAKASGRVDARVLRVKALAALGDTAGVDAVRGYLQEQHAGHPLVIELERTMGKYG